MNIQKNYSNFSTESLRESYINNILDRNGHIHNFISMLFNIEMGGVIAIDGEWGSGKTYFVHQVKWLLDYASGNTDSEVETVLSRTVPRLHNIKEHKYKVFYYDAWKYDKSNNPFFTLLRSLILTFGGIDFFKEEKSITDSLFSAIADIINGVSSIRMQSLFNFGRAFCGFNAKEQLPAIEFIEQMDDQVHSFLDYACEGQYDKLIIFIDELDRCKPSFAIELLEIMKHYFNHDKVVFVLSTNLSEFQYCVKQYYGEGFNGWKYLDRFIDLRITLPQISVEAYYKYLWKKTGTDKIDNISIACADYFKLNLREIERYNQHINISFCRYIRAKSINNGFSDELDSLYAIFIPILLALKLYSSDKFKEFISGRDYDVIKGLLSIDRFKKNVIFFILSANEDLSENRGDLLVRKLEYCYNQLFNPDFELLYEKNEIDDLMLKHFTIDSDTKSHLLNILNLFSGKAKFDI